MKENVLENLVKERIKENEKLFSKEEIELIKDNIILVEKIFLIGILDEKIARKY